MLIQPFAFFPVAHNRSVFLPIVFTMTKSDASSLGFPHLTLTPFKENAPPDPSAVRLLKTEVYTNARAVFSSAGGGAHGHLGAVMPDAGYRALSNNVAFVPPTHPGPQPNIQGMTQIQVTAALRAYDEDLEAFQTYLRVMAALKAQILTAVPAIYLQAVQHIEHGYAEVSVLQMIEHLHSTYGTLTPTEIEMNRRQLSTPWNPDEPIETLWTNIKRIRDVAAGAGDPIPDTAVITLTLEALGAAGVYQHAITIWRDMPPAQQTFANFKEHINRAERNRAFALTSEGAGFQRANHVPAAEPPPPKPVVTPPRRARVQDTPISYCWTHGFIANLEHTSATCTNRAEGHDVEATGFNRKGGSARVGLGRSGPRRPQADS